MTRNFSWSQNYSYKRKFCLSGFVITGSLLTFSHVSVSCDGAPLSRLLTRASGRQTNQTDALLEVGLAVQLQQGDVVVEGLRVVVVVDVGRGHAQRLSAGGTELLGQIVVAHADVNRVSGANDAANFIYFSMTSSYLLAKVRHSCCAKLH